ncbi:helix-turn-helix transcriptional regulator [Chroococcidiopsidales cyanobacterium LEGE 13417]|nr:helix-turn-helix transcriptional regulator [Chroococcidiopsidales cyanobacterium LEGE 13417]
MGRSLKASENGVKRARKAMTRLAMTQAQIAEEVGLARSTVQKFFSRKAVDRTIFYEICSYLNLDAKEIIEVLPLKEHENEVEISRVERSIEFPPEYWEAGTSILSYFNRVLNVKYPNKKIKVKIEQEGLMLRMIIDTPTGEREEIEKTLEEYGMVVTGKLQPERFLTDPFEAMALKNKLEIADLELRQTRNLLDFTRDNSQQRIESLEIQVKKLHFIIEKGLQSGDHVFGVIRKMAEQDKSTYNLSNAKFGGGFAAEGGFQVGGNLIDLSSANNLTDAAQQIQELLQQLQGQGVSIEDAKQQAANDLARQAETNPTVMGKLVKWGQSLADTAGKTTVSEAAKGVVKLALQMSGIPLP